MKGGGRGGVGRSTLHQQRIPVQLLVGERGEEGERGRERGREGGREGEVDST